MMMWWQSHQYVNFLYDIMNVFVKYLILINEIAKGQRLHSTFQNSFKYHSPTHFRLRVIKAFLFWQALCLNESMYLHINLTCSHYFSLLIKQNRNNDSLDCIDFDNSMNFSLTFLLLVLLFFISKNSHTYLNNSYSEIKEIKKIYT